MRLRLSAVSGAYRLAWRGTRPLPAPEAAQTPEGVNPLCPQGTASAG